MGALALTQRPTAIVSSGGLAERAALGMLRRVMTAESTAPAAPAHAGCADTGGAVPAAPRDSDAGCPALTRPQQRQLLQNLQTLSQTVTIMQAALGANEQEVRELREQVKAARDQASARRGDVSRLKAEIETYKQAFDRLNARVREAVAGRQAAEERAARLQARTEAQAAAQAETVRGLEEQTEKCRS